MTDREKELEEALTSLVAKHFCKKTMEWSYVEGVSLFEVDFNLFSKILRLVPSAFDNL